jgi:hypothetical protein
MLHLARKERERESERERGEEGWGAAVAAAGESSGQYTRHILQKLT